MLLAPWSLLLLVDSSVRFAMYMTVKHKTFISGLDMTMYLVTVAEEFLHLLAKRIGCSLYLALDLR